MLDISVAAVKSALQRARARLQMSPRVPTRSSSRRNRGRAAAREVHDGVENTDMGLLEEALRHDAALEMVGSRTWFAGRTTCLPYLAGVVGVQSDWRMVAITANGRPRLRPTVATTMACCGRSGSRCSTSPRRGSPASSCSAIRPGHTVRSAADRGCRRRDVAAQGRDGALSTAPGGIFRARAGCRRISRASRHGRGVHRQSSAGAWRAHSRPLAVALSCHLP